MYVFVNGFHKKVGTNMASLMAHLMMLYSTVLIP